MKNTFKAPVNNPIIADRIDKVNHKSNSQKELGNVDKKKSNQNTNNPWSSGMFYLLVGVITITGLAVLGHLVHLAVLPIVIVGGILFTGIIGALQLRNDGRLKDKSFVKLMIETYKRLPLLKSIRNRKK